MERHTKSGNLLIVEGGEGYTGSLGPTFGARTESIAHRLLGVIETGDLAHLNLMIRQSDVVMLKAGTCVRLLENLALSDGNGHIRVFQRFEMKQERHFVKGDLWTIPGSLMVKKETYWNDHSYDFRAGILDFVITLGVFEAGLHCSTTDLKDELKEVKSVADGADNRVGEVEERVGVLEFIST